METFQPFNFSDFETRRVLIGSTVYNHDTLECYTLSTFLHKGDEWYAQLTGDTSLYSSQSLCNHYNFLDKAYHDKPFGEEIKVNLN